VGQCIIEPSSLELTVRTIVCGLLTNPPWDVVLGQGDTIFYPQLHGGSGHATHAAALSAFQDSAPGLKEEIEFMQAKGWVTRVITKQKRSGGDGEAGPEVDHVDYLLPSHYKPRTARQTPRESLTWRKIRQEDFDAVPIPESSRVDAAELSSSLRAYVVALAYEKWPSMEAEAETHHSRGFIVRHYLREAHSSARKDTQKTITIESIEYIPGERASMRDIHRAIASAMSPRLR